MAREETKVQGKQPNQPRPVGEEEFDDRDEQHAGASPRAAQPPPGQHRRGSLRPDEDDEIDEAIGPGMQLPQRGEQRGRLPTPQRPRAGP